MIPFKKAIAIIFLSILIVTGTAASIIFYLQQIANARGQDPNFHIVAIAQKSSVPESLPTAYLAELLGLSVDRMHNLYRFDVVEAQNKLNASPLIRKAEITKIKPGTLYIDYTLRHPIAYSGDLTNTAIGFDGVLIPFKPYFRPKKMAEIVTGSNKGWGEALDHPEGALALEIFDYLTHGETAIQGQLVKIDTSRAYDPSYGQRQVIVEVEEIVRENGKSIKSSRILRLGSDAYKAGITEYKQLHDAIAKKKLFQSDQSLIIDLRIPALAFISTR